ncbi:MAG: S9 family peptidase [Acidimicrobiia bacterium]|nr:S9 family peptidase [Acidimicrobiia bacterium]
MASKSSGSVPPKAKQVPVERHVHGETTVDPFAWLRDRDDPDTIAYLEAENEYTEAALEPTAPLRARLFEEIRSRVQETDLSVPNRKGTWWYYNRTEEGAQYGISCRRAAADDLAYDEHAPEQVLLDQNVEAEGHEYFAVGVFEVSHDHSLLAWAADTNGSEKYELRFRDLGRGVDLDDTISGVYYGSAWAADNRTFFYVRPDDSMRPYQLWRHVLGTPTAEDVLVYQEDDERFFLGVGSTRDERYIALHCGSKVTDEWRLLDADDPTGTPRVVAEREQGVEYGVDHHSGRLFIVTNADGAENFKLVEAPADTPGREHWRDVIGPRDDVKLSGVEAFVEHLLLYERSEGLQRIRVRRLADGEEWEIDQPEAVGTATGSANPEFDTTVIRYGYQSMVTPSSLFEYDLVTRERRVLKQQPVLGGYDPSEYATERVWAPADDGVEVPVSLVYRRGLARDGSAPALLYGYGSYEASVDPYFSSIRLSLLDRGFVFAIAHIRGGGEMGRRWYLDGKFLNKRNTFTDFVAAARHLVGEGWTSPARLAIRGGSAGGLLMGAVVNEAPDLFGAVVAEVPFVDALNTILDPLLPLTVLEWEEWGNPVASAEYYAYMKSYAPYENVEAKDYPPMLVTAGLNDPRVSYWEPAKWVAKLRVTKTDANPLLLKTEMGAGHGGPSGRYDVWRDEALVLAFVIDTVGAPAEPAPGTISSRAPEPAGA